MQDTIHETGPGPTDIKLVDINRACQVLGGDESPLNRATLYRGIQDGRFPRPIKIGPNMSRWNEFELLAVVGSRMAARDQATS